MYIVPMYAYLCMFTSELAYTDQNILEFLHE
jgi:hypothetical protein